MMFRCRRTSMLLRRVARRSDGRGTRGDQVAALRKALTRWGWRVDLGYGRTVCRDRRGRRVVLLVLPAGGGVVLVPSRSGPLYFDSLSAGALRGAVQTAVLSADPSVPLEERAELTRRPLWIRAVA